MCFSIFFYYRPVFSTILSLICFGTHSLLALTTLEPSRLCPFSRRPISRCTNYDTWVVHAWSRVQWYPLPNRSLILYFFHNYWALPVFLYLNNVDEGGGTKFRDLDITVQPKTGKAVLWPSVLDEFPDRKDRRTSHEALPVKKGIKYGGRSNAQWCRIRKIFSVCLETPIYSFLYNMLSNRN